MPGTISVVLQFFLREVGSSSPYVFALTVPKCRSVRP